MRPIRRADRRETNARWRRAFGRRRPGWGLALPMFAIYPDAEPPGPAGRWMIKLLKSCQEKVTAEKHIDSTEYL